MVLDGVELGKGAIHAFRRVEHRIDISWCHAVCHQSHLDKSVTPGMNASFAREFFDIEKVCDGLRITCRISIKGTLLIERNVRPEDLRHYAVVRDFDHDVVIH